MEFLAFVRHSERYSDLAGAFTLGRGELGSRMDTLLEVSSNLWVYIPAITGFLAEKIEVDPGILATSVYTRLTSVLFVAELFANSLMWEFVFNPMRALTKDNEAGLDALQLAPLLDEVYELGQRLVSEPMLIVDAVLKDPMVDDFMLLTEPWGAKLPEWKRHQWERLATRPGEKKGVKGLKVKIPLRESFAAFGGAADFQEEYGAALSAVFTNWGNALQTSLKRNVPNFLTCMEGVYSAGKQEAWMLENASSRVATNDYAESTFALFKWYIKAAPSLGLSAAAGMVSGKMNKRWGPADVPLMNKSKNSEKRRRDAKGDGRAFSLEGPLLRAVVATVNGSFADERLKSRLLLQQQDAHTAAHRAAKMEAKKKKEAGRVANAVCARVVVRAKTLTKLKRLIKGKKGAERNDILGAQVKQRTVGCGLGEMGYGFKISLFSGISRVNEKFEALYKQLCKMIKMENTAANRAVLQTPEDLPFRSSFNPPKLGAYTAERKAHELSAQARWAALEEKDDTSELVALDAKYKGKLFYDAEAKEHRRIVDVEWNDQFERYQVLTDKVYAPGTDQAGTRMQRYARVGYGVAEEEQPEMDGMVAKYQELCEKAEEGQRKKKKTKKRGAAGPKDCRKPKKRQRR
jgi:hypothetical protein